MPRDGLQQYSPPPGTEGIPNYTVESARYNAFVADVTQDLNLPRPIVAGGTGASTPDGALDNISAEKFKQVVTNWDSMVWRAGSFYAATTATGAAPVAGHAFAGIAYYANATDFVLKATDLTDPAAPADYTRVMAAGVWSAWAQTGGNSVRYDGAQSLTEPQRVQARQNIYAAPFDALAYNGMQINGSMEVSQEIGFGGIAGAAGFLDRSFMDGWRFSKNGTMIVDYGVNLVTSVPALPYGIFGAATTAQASLGTSDGVVFQQRIEGYRTSRLAWGTANAQPITIGFWTNHWRAGIYSIAVRNAAASRSYVASYTHAVSNTPQFNTVTIPGETTGVWGIGNGVGLDIVFTMASGAAPVSSPNTWVTGSTLVYPGQVNAVASTNDAFRLTGFVVLPGIEAPTAAQSPLIMRPFDQELVTCQRYFWKGRGQSLKGIVQSGVGLVNMSMTAPTPFRATPTISIPAPIAIMDGISYLSTITGVSVNNSTTDAIVFNPAVGASPPTAGAIIITNAGGNSGFLAADARL